MHFNSVTRIGKYTVSHKMSKKKRKQNRKVLQNGLKIIRQLRLKD